MLDARAEALNAGNVEGYLQHTLPPVREIERPIVEASRRVPIKDFSLQLANSATPDADGSFKDVGVDLVYKFEGLPSDNLFRLQFRYSLEKVGSWTVVQSSLKDTQLPIWFSGPVEHSRFGMFLAVFRPGTSGIPGTLQLAQNARDALSAKVTHQLEDGYLILLARDREEYLDMTAKSSPVSTIAQAETTYQVSSTSIEVQSRYIVINLDQLYTSGSATETLQHELGHLALATQTRPFTPAWVSESAAMYLADTRPRSAWRAGVRNRKFDEISLVELMRSTSLGQHGGTAEAASYEYAYAAAAAYYLIETFGLEKFWTFYASFADVPPGTVFERIPDASDSNQSTESLRSLGEEITIQSLQSQFVLTIEQLDTNVKDWIRKEAQRR